MKGPVRPAVSVLIPAFNRRRWLGETLSSVRSQTMTDHETLLVDDGSTDGTTAWVRRAFPEVRVFRLPRNAGPAAARNRGVRAARAPLIAFLDADDVWREEYLRTLVPEFRDPRVVVTFCGYERIDAQGRVIANRASRRSLSRIYPVPPMSASIMRRDAIERAGGFDTGFQRLFDDVDLFSRLALRHGPRAFRRVRRALAGYRLHDEQLTSALKPSIAVWFRQARSKHTVDRRARLDLAYLGFKHRILLESMLAAAPLFPRQTPSANGYGLFEFALRRGAGFDH